MDTVSFMRDFNSRIPSPYDGYKRIDEPDAGQEVFYVDDNGQFTLVRITGGTYFSNGRVSNFWYWKEVLSDGSLSDEKHGYGNFYVKTK